MPQFPHPTTTYNRSPGRTHLARGFCLLGRALATVVPYHARRMPIITTGYEPGAGWTLEAEKVYAKDAAGTQVVAEYADVRVLSVAGIDLWSGIGNIDNLHAQLSAGGLWIYYMSLWRNPPGFFIGFDDYRAITVHRP
jgi:hypothetical protein